VSFFQGAWSETHTIDILKTFYGWRSIKWSEDLILDYLAHFLIPNRKDLETYDISDAVLSRHKATHFSYY
jgi:hypothetical protein